MDWFRALQFVNWYHVWIQWIKQFSEGHTNWKYILLKKTTAILKIDAFILFWQKPVERKTTITAHLTSETWRRCFEGRLTHVEKWKLWYAQRKETHWQEILVLVRLQSTFQYATKSCKGGAVSPSCSIIRIKNGHGNMRWFDPFVHIFDSTLITVQRTRLVM